MKTRDPLPKLSGPEPGSTWRHLKSGGVYEVLGLCRIEASLAPVVAYREVSRAGEEPKDGFTRDIAEFMDGRFEKISDPAPKLADPDADARIEDLTRRLAAAEEKLQLSMGVGDGRGNLFVYGDSDAISAALRLILNRIALKRALEMAMPFVDCAASRAQIETLARKHMDVKKPDSIAKPAAKPVSEGANLQEPMPNPGCAPRVS